jgi:ssDNA-binding Zn-finger/Zn-ribbon topoisomerase 1
MKPKFLENTESAVLCPECNPPRKLIVKTNQHNGSQFLGCPNYPDCHHTQPIPEEWVMRMEGQRDLFSIFYEE